jgi:DNA-binding NtrC family response regulator
MNRLLQEENGNVQKPSEGGPRTLLVDDDPDLVEITYEMLELAGCRVTTSMDPEEALALIKERINGGEKFDLLFTDYRFPGSITGIELANQATVIMPDMKVVIATGFDSQTIEAQSRPGYVHVPKPFSIASLKEIVSNLFQKNLT